MMRAAIIGAAGEVVNLIMVDSAEDYPGCIICQDEVAIGWTYDGMAFAQPAPSPETAEQTVKRLTDAVQRHMDVAAQSKGYDSIISACSYAGAPNAFQAEAAAFLSWRADVWSRCYAIMAECQAGTREIPEVAALLAELPPQPA